MTFHLSMLAVWLAASGITGVITGIIMSVCGFGTMDAGGVGDWLLPAGMAVLWLSAAAFVIAVGIQIGAWAGG